MRIELRVCRHCFEGEHDNEHKTQVTRDLVACAEIIDDYLDKIELENIHIRWITDDESDDGRPAALPAVSATIQNEQIVVPDTQLITMGENGYMMVYPNPQDALQVLAGNIDEINRITDENVMPKLSQEGAEILSGAATQVEERDEDSMYEV